MSISFKHRTVKVFLMVFLAGIILSLGPGPHASYAEILSGADANTLVREPQQTPDGLGAFSLDGLQFADPAAQIDLIQPPTANNQGTAQLSHPLNIPPGRSGVQPDLALTYDSSGDNGWTGLGWDISSNEVTIDTRWGVPRYDADKETETYILDGQVLSPTAVRSLLLDREADRQFKRRVEGDFERVVRHGSGPGSYWWQVTDKSGTERYYGGLPETGRDTASILADDGGNGFSWALKQVRDISGNTMTYQYSEVTGAGVGVNNSAVGREMYLESIVYTGLESATLPNDPAYEVRFIRDSQLGEARRPDISIDGRGGFLRVTADLLRHVEIYYRGALVRQYTLNYTTGAYSKTLLDNIVQIGTNGSEYARHTLEYYDDVRSGSTYAGFESETTWNTGVDGVGDGIDLAGIDSSASALGGSSSSSFGGRAYIGFNPLLPSKGGSAGGAFSLDKGQGGSILELLDINGDNLPDKVFEEAGAVMVRLNTSGPGGTTTFGPKQTVAGLDNLSRESSFQFGIGPEAYLGVNVMYNHAWTWSWGEQYFVDVNADGLPDFVNRGTVHFNHLDNSGIPVFSLLNSVTAVPIDGGVIDASVLQGLQDTEDQQRAVSPLQDTLRRWTAPFSGSVNVTGNVQLIQPDPGEFTSDGVRVSIQRSGTVFWSTTINGTDYTAKTPTGVNNISVIKGDHIYFRVQSIDDGASDEVSWDPLIVYNGPAPTEDANGLDVYRYQASEDFTLGGRGGIGITLPMSGTIQVEGLFTKTHFTSDGIRAQVIYDGNIIDLTSFTDAYVGSFLIQEDINVLDGKSLELRLVSDSPIDLSTISWTPKLTYLVSTAGKTIFDDNGDPLFAYYPPVDVQMFPRSNLTGPQTTWKATDNGTITISPSATFSGSEDGSIAVTVKKKITPANTGDAPSDIVGKKVLTVVNGAVTTSPATFTLAVNKDAEYWFDMSVPQPALGSTWTGGSISINYPSKSAIDPPQARHWAYIPETVFPMAYRGWGIAGYNGDGALAAQAVIESNLAFNTNNYPMSAPQVNPPPGNEDYPTLQDVDANYKNPALGASFIFAPYIELDDLGNIQDRRWIGSKENMFGSADGAGSSRIGPDSIGLPGSNDLLGARAVTRFSVTNADAIAGDIGGVIGGSLAWGFSQGFIDYFDLNGDQFPDIVGNNGVQFSTPRGGIESSARTITQLNTNLREDSSMSKILQGGGTAAEISADSKGDSNTAQDVESVSGQEQSGGEGEGDGGSSKSGEDSQASVMFGFGGNLSWSSTNKPDNSPLDDLLEVELADINGDGLADRILVYKDGRVGVHFNLGYDFYATEIAWAGNSFETGESFAFGLGPSLGFTIGNLEFSGGISLSRSNEESRSTWVDLNGDNIIDQLIRTDGGQVLVRFGTGGGLTNSLNFGSFRSDKIATSTSTSLGVGADFTIPIGPLCVATCYLIINPGGNVEGGISRQELELNDVNGDEFPDHVGSVDDNEMFVRLNKTGRTNLLKSVDNPLGGSIALDYTRDGNTVEQPLSIWVMSRVEVNDGRPGDGQDQRLTTYEYEDNAYNHLEREVLGYSLVTEHQHDTSVTGDPIYRSFEREYLNGSIFETGLLIRDKFVGFSGMDKETVNEYEFVDVDTSNVITPSTADGVDLLELSVFPRLVKMEQRWYDGAVIGKNTWTTFTYDALGNITEIHDVGEPDLPGDDLVALSTYTTCTEPDNTWVALPDTFEIRDGSGNLLRSRRGEVLCENGAATKLWETVGFDSNNNPIEAESEFDFDDWGNYNYIIYPPNNNGERYEVTYVFDADRHTDIAHIEDSFGLVGEATYHGPTGQLASQTDANGQVTSMTYDSVGRLTAITGPYEQGTGNATVSFEYFPTDLNYAYGLAHHHDALLTAGSIDTASFMDGIGRQTQTKQDATVYRGVNLPAENVMVVSGAFEYDAVGRVVKEWYPTEEPLGTIGTFNSNADAVNPTITSYSTNDLETNAVSPDGSTVSISYGFDSGALLGTNLFLASRSDQLGNVRNSYSDVRDNLRAFSVEHDNGASIQSLTTTYEYDGLQMLTRVVDTDLSETIHEYDLLGRLTATTTPDGGLVELEYDLASNVINKQTPNLRAAGDVISYSYDFNRLVGISYSDSTPDVTYEYGDASAPDNGVGRIVYVDDGAKEQTRKFGPLGEIVEETTTMKVHNLKSNNKADYTWTTKSLFDTWGRRKQMIYPDGELVQFQYDSGGLLRSFSGRKGATNYNYLDRLEYDKFLARRYQETGNDVQTETFYNPQTRRMEHQIITSNKTGRLIQDLHYSYDTVGNILAMRNDAPTPVNNSMGGTSQQLFFYDDLYRLVIARGAFNTTNGKTQRYEYDLTYDNLGNILHKSQKDLLVSKNNKVREQKATSYDWVYSYNAAPHQPTQIGDRTYSYDANGNFTGWTTGGSKKKGNNNKGRTVDWDAEDRVIRVADNGADTDYKYDDEDKLGIERGPNGETAFVNRFYTIRNGNVAWKHFWAGEERIATKKQESNTNPEDKLYYLNRDLLGSANLATDINGAVFEFLLYFPSGETWIWEHSNIHLVPFLFGGYYYDEFRTLYNVGARWYEPRDQFFYSTDPLLVQGVKEVLEDPALLGAYTYAEDNPVRLVDRDGRAPESAQAYFRAAFSRPDGGLDQAKVRLFKTLIMQNFDKLVPGKATRFIAKAAADPKKSAKKVHKAVASFEGKPIVQVNFKRTPDGYKLKDVKVAPFFFKQFTVKKGKAFSGRSTGGSATKSS